MLLGLELDDTAHGGRTAVNSLSIPALQSYTHFLLTAHALDAIPSAKGLSWLSTPPLKTGLVVLTTTANQSYPVTDLTEVMITELPEEKKEPAGGGHAGHSHGMEGMY